MSEYKSAKNHCQEKQGLALLFVLACALLLAFDQALAAAQAQEVPHDQLTVQAACLDRLSLARPNPWQPGWVLKPKALPASAAAYLKPTPLIDAHHSRVLKAVRRLMQSLGWPSSEAMKDADFLAQAVRAWVAEQLPQAQAEGEDLRRQEAMEPRQLLPKASALLAKGQADEEGRLRVRLALLRALGVPARSAQLRGQPALQYWAAYGPKIPKDEPQGEWRFDEGLLPGEIEDSHSLDASELPLALWDPPQELAYESERSSAYYSLSERAQAEADLEQLRQGKALSQIAPLRALPMRPGKQDKVWEFLRLSAHRAKLQAQGSIQALPELRLLLPWNAAQVKSREAKPLALVRERLGQGLWLSRPTRLRAKKPEFLEEWHSPPPAQGMTRHASLALRRPARILFLSQVSKSQVTGVLRRADSLSPVPAATLVFEHGSLSSSAKTADDGSFTWSRDPKAKDAALKIFCKDSSGLAVDSVWLP